MQRYHQRRQNRGGSQHPCHAPFFFVSLLSYTLDLSLTAATLKDLVGSCWVECGLELQHLSPGEYHIMSYALVGGLFGPE